MQKIQGGGGGNSLKLRVKSEEVRVGGSSWRFGNLLAFLFAVAFSFNAVAVSVCAVGDSITQGSSNFTAHRIALESRFNELGWNVEWKGTRADASWGSNNPCEGYSGKNAVEIAAQYESHASAVAADILLLHAGHNYNAGDTNLSPTPMSEEAIIAAVTNAHARIIAAARAQNPDVIVLYAKVITSGGNRAVKYSYIPALNTAIGVLADELNTNVSPVICVDMAGGWNYATDCVSDCVHPNATGAAKMADKWVSAIQPFVAEGLLNVDGANNSWIVTENTVLTSDRTIGALTVNAGVKLDLNGYKLTCSSVNGSGTITSTVKSGDVDVTSPTGEFKMVSPSAYTKGPVSNIFNDNTYYSQGDKDRLLLDLNKSVQKLPLIIDYDFGDGNKKVVNAYKIYAAWRERAPKAWTLYGSNDSSAYNSTTDDGWTAIHSVSGETSWTKSSGKNYESESRSYGCINSTSYRYYRLKITEHVGSNSYFELVQLEYFSTTPGELHLNVASGEEAQWPSGINFVGNLKIIKKGVGALKATGDLNLNEGTFAIKSGTVAVDGVMRIACSSGKAAEVVVDGGTLTVNNSNSIASSATGIVVGNNGVGTLTVNNGIMTVASNRDTYFAWESTGSGVINLNGGTLVSRRLLTKNGSSRTLNFNGGILKANGVVSSNGFIANGINVNVGEKGGTIDSGNLSDATTGSRLFVAADIGGTGALRFKGGKTINVDGEVKCEGGSIIELGTKIVASKEFLNKSLKVDGRAALNATQPYDVLVQGGLTSDSLAKVSLENCASGSEVVLDNPDNPTKIVVNLAAATGIGTETPVLVFPETTLQQIKFAKFTSRMFGKNVNSAFNALDSVSGYNKKLYYGNEGNLESIIVEFKYITDGKYIRCVVVEFTDGHEGVYAKALGAAYYKNISTLDTALYLEDRSWSTNGKDGEKTVATVLEALDYGVCDIRWALGEGMKNITLDTEKNFSQLITEEALNSDDVVYVEAKGNYTLTVDENITVKNIEFVNGSGATFKISENYTLSVDDIVGVGNIMNNGTIVKTGEGTAILPFDNASTGVLIVGNGTLKVKSVINDGTAYTVRVKRGATFDLNGVSGITVNVILEEGATFVNTGNAISYNADQTVKIILDGDATVKTENEMGLIAPDCNMSELNLGSHILTLKGGNTFRLCNTAVVGSGKIRVTNSGKLTVMASSEGAAGNYSSGGDNYELVMESGSTLTIGNYQSLTVKNFTNNGVITTTHKGTLIVKGILAPGNEIPVLTLADGATIKASATQVQTVSSTFSASGTITIDASEIMKDQLKVAGKTGIPVLTVPAVPSDAKWNVTGVKVDSVRAKWRVNEDGTKTLYIVRRDGFRIIVR